MHEVKTIVAVNELTIPLPNYKTERINTFPGNNKRYENNFTRSKRSKFDYYLLVVVCSKGGPVRTEWRKIGGRGP